jgi:hypothetical protein
VKSPRIRLLFLSFVCVLGAGSSLQAQVIYNLNTQAFTFPDNPGGVGGLFSYGTKTSATATALALYDSEDNSTYGPIDVYFSSTSPTGVDPNVVFNPANDAINFGPGNSPANTQGLDSVIRFTAPSAGLYNVALTFSNASGVATTDVHFVENGTSLFDSYININGGGQTATYANVFPLNLAAGAELDFVVGNGGNTYGGDTTGLIATITELPEPSTYAMLLGGFGMLVLVSRFRSKMTA